MIGHAFGPNYDWALPPDWREIGALSEIALGYLDDFMNAEEGDPMTLDYLSDVVGAADLILQIPKNLRGPAFDTYNKRMRQSTAPRLRKVKAVVQLGLNPLNAAIGLFMFAMTRLDHEEIDFVELVANSAREDALLIQLKHCLEEYPEFRGDLLFERELGRAVYWYAFQEIQHWELRPEFRLTPDTANAAMKRHRLARDEEYADPEFKFNVWVHSPYCKKPLEAIGNKNFYIKKMSKGRRFPKIERAWVEHSRTIEARHRYLFLYAERDNWQRT
jgi:hypothetical protein